MGKAKGKSERREKIELTLGVKLTNEELLAAGTLLVGRLFDRDAVEERRKEKLSSFKAELDAIDKEISAMRRLFHSGVNEELVVCEVVYDFADSTVTIYRTDTGEVESERPMEDADRQEQFKG